MDRDSDIDEAEDRFVREEIDEIFRDTNQSDGDGLSIEDERKAAKYFSDSLDRDEKPERPQEPSVDEQNMEPDPKPNSYYGGGVGPDLSPPMSPGATLMLEKIRVALKTLVSPAVLSQMKFSADYDPVTDRIMVELGMYLFSNKIHTETTKENFPAGWFQGFKQALFPGWLKNKFPVKYTQIFKEVKTIHICPHLNYHTRSDEKFHLQFLMPEGDLTRHSA